MLVLWQFEECEHSRPVRRRLTEMGLDFVAVNAPAGYPEKDVVMRKLFGNSQVPALWDTRTGVLLQGESHIIDYVEDHYAVERPRD